jgi:hypothetical protein
MRLSERLDRLSDRVVRLFSVAASVRTAATRYRASIHGRDVLSRRSSRRCPPANRTDEQRHSHLPDSHTCRRNASKLCRPDRKRWPTKGRIPQSLLEQCLSAHQARCLAPTRTLRLRGRKWRWPTATLSRNLSLQTPFCFMLCLQRSNLVGFRNLPTNARLAWPLGLAFGTKSRVC